MAPKPAGIRRSVIVTPSPSTSTSTTPKQSELDRLSGLLNRKGTIPVKDVYPEFYCVVQGGSLLSVRAYLRDHPSSINERTQRKLTPLHAAARLVDGEPIIGELLKTQPSLDLEAVDVLGDTPLFTAVQFNALGNAKLLLSLGVNPRHRNLADHTLLHDAVLYEAVGTFNWILEQRLVDIDATQQDWTRTALTFAVVNKAPVKTFVIPLLQAGASVTIPTESNRTVIQEAILKRHLVAFKAILDSHPEAALQKDLLKFAALNCGDTIEMIRGLLEAGADPSLPDDNGLTPLDHAILIHGSNIKNGIVEAIATSPQGLQALNQPGSTWWRTPLNCVVAHEHTEAISLFLALGADPSLADQYGHTALDLAVKNFGDKANSPILAAILRSESGRCPGKQDRIWLVAHLPHPGNFSIQNPCHPRAHAGWSRPHLAGRVQQDRS